MIKIRPALLKYAFLLLLLLVLVSGCIPYPGSQNKAPTAEVTATPPAPTVLPSPTTTPTEEGCREVAGTVERVKMPSKLLASPMWVLVYLPPCYSATPDKPYPVLYLLHGQSMDDSFWQGLGVTQIADEAILNGQRPFLIVLPYEERNYDAISDSKFDDSLIEELIPWVDATYPTCTLRECRSIGGISRGGGWAVHVAVRNFDLFGAVGAHSMGLMAGDRGMINTLLKTHTVAEFPRYYIDRGEDDYLAGDIDLFEATLTSNGIPHEYHISPGSHTPAYWQAHVQEYMDWYMAGWQ